MSSASSATAANDGSWSTLTKVLAGAASAAVVGAVAYVGYSYSQYANETEIKKNQKAKPKFKPVKGGASAAVSRLTGSKTSKKAGKTSSELVPLPVQLKPKSSSTPSAKALVESLARSVERIRRSKEIVSSDKTLMSHVRTIDVSEYETSADRMLVAQFMILYYTLLSASVTSEAEFTQMVKDQKADLPLTWNLLLLPAQDKDVTEEMRGNADQFLMDIATRMQDGHRLSAVFDRIISRGLKSMTDHEILGAFTVACGVGRWSKFRELGAEFIRRRNTLAMFHHQAMQQATMPDFEQLYRMAETEAKTRGDTDLNELRWAPYLVKSMYLELKDADSNDPKLLGDIRSDFKSGKDVAVPQQRVIRTGAFAQMISPSSIPIPLIGPATNSRISIAGYLDMPPHTSNNQQKEEYEFELVKTEGKLSTWKGTYIMTSSQGTAVAAQKMRLVFSATMVMQEEDVEAP